MENKVSIEIYGIPYPITTNEKPDYVLSMAKEIDTSLRSLLGPGSKLSVHEASILLNLNFLDAANKAKENANQLREQISEYLEESAKARMELSDAKSEIERLTRQLESHNK